MSLFQIPNSIYIGVTDAAATSSWYKEKLGPQQVLVSMEDAGECISLAFSKRDEKAVILGPRDTPTDGIRSAQNHRKGGSVVSPAS
jgi:hypothetical protein